ncbi:hypothetical protein GCM10010339_81760 [Streptomyces alanosinicus]|uniref:Uncharacterized protein n=1 Tax=Streptomyces alanosinicus TaxID=68171 RepID=A0A918YSD0_9ACTN|nr:hypothetical protein GCM10010339_81760 [Streptomyces alanosinicus]
MRFANGSCGSRKGSVCGVCAVTWDPLEMDRHEISKRFDAYATDSQVSRDQHRFFKQYMRKEPDLRLGGILGATLVCPWAFI